MAEAFVRHLPLVVKSFFTHPTANMSIVRQAVAVRQLQNSQRRRPLVISTHHKALTVLFGRILKTFGLLTGESFSEGRGEVIDWHAGLILDHHSHVDRSQLVNYQGIHIRRDPRDIIISCAHYHQQSTEPWLDKPQDVFDGRCYRDMIKDLPDLDAIIQFEMDHVAGRIIRDMLQWNYNDIETIELKYEDLISDYHYNYMEIALEQMNLHLKERELLLRLYNNFALGGPWLAKKHVRNPKSGQGKLGLKGASLEKFNHLFPDALEKLGYA